MATVLVEFAPPSSPIDSAPSDIYVNGATGSDSTGDGSSGAPFATLTKARSLLGRFVFEDHNFHVADATYAEAIQFPGLLVAPGHRLTVIGNTTTPGNVVFTGTVSLEIQDGVTFTVGAAISGPIWVELEGLTVTVSADRGVMVQNGAHLIFDRSKVTGGSVGAAINASTNGFVRFEGNCTLGGFTWTGLYVNEGAGWSYAGSSATLTITGAGSATTGIGMHHGYCLVFGGTAYNITITNVGVGIGIGFNSTFTWQGTGSTISITNTSTPSNSSGIHSGDVSTFSTNQAVILDHFTTGFSADSISYIEATGSRTLTNIGTTHSESQNSVIYLP